MSMEKLAETPKKKSEIEQVLPPSLIEALKSAPLNQMIRTQVHARVLVPIPEERKTFDQIKEWIEFNFDPATLKVAKGLSIRVNYKEVEYGTCSYSVTRYGESQETFSREEMIEFCMDAECLDDLMTAVKDAAREDTRDEPPETEWGDDFETSNCESTSTDDSTTSVRHDEANAAISEWLRINLPDEYERLA